jgi:O-antigen/teichoic acid export membrane protein
MMLAQTIVTVVGGLVSIYAVRHLPASSWGHYSTALALVALFTILSGPGLGPLTLRRMTAAPSQQNEILAQTFEALLWTFPVAAVLLIGTAAVLGYPHEVFVLVLILAPFVLLDPALTNVAAAFNARSRLFYVACIQLVQVLVYGALAVLAIETSRGVTGLATATVVAAACALVLALVLLRNKLGLRLALDQPRRRAWSFLRAAVPIAGTGFVGVVYDRVDVVLLSVLANARAVALYAVPFSLVRLTWILPSVVSAAFFPLLSRRLSSDRAEAKYLFLLVVRVFVFVSVPISLFVAVSSPTLLPFIFGDRYVASVQVLEIMAWTSVFGFQNYILWYGVLAIHKERVGLFIQLVGLAVNIAINAFAIPLYGARGAATALVISDFVVVVGQAVLIHRDLFRLPFRKLLTKPAVAAAIVVPLSFVIARETAVGAAIIGSTAYAAILLLTRYVTLEEWSPVVATVRAPFARLSRGRFAST